ncbi:MAG: AraC family transcriptional regulator [Cytophagales bacterium]|nr:AraC family transcriptional regulator [Cytophagales bacterium]
MKTLIEKWIIPREHSFNVRGYELANNPEGMVMRMHDEYEVSILPNARGKRFIGNTIESFAGGDMFLIGPKVPHAVQFDTNVPHKVITIHFLYDSLGKGFFDLPENNTIKDLLRDARLGIAFPGQQASRFYPLIRQLNEVRGFERLMVFLRLLNEMSQTPHKKILSSRGFVRKAAPKDYEVVNKVYEYIITRFQDQDISLEDISGYANMSPNTFCRFFKKHFHKNFTKFLNEVRIGHACKLLQETDKNVSEIAFASGYNQITHFNRQFKQIIGYSPKAYRKELD